MTELSIRNLTTALEVANLVRQLPIEEGAKLIEQYAATHASGAKLDKGLEIYGRLSAKPIDGPLGD
jgi:hypothetical protein